MGRSRAEPFPIQLHQESKIEIQKSKIEWGPRSDLHRAISLTEAVNRYLFFGGNKRVVWEAGFAPTISCMSRRCFD